MSLVAGAAAGSLPVRIPLTLRSLDALTARALGVIGPGALLVRPVGRPAALWGSDQGAWVLRNAVRSVAAAVARGWSFRQAST